MSTKWSNLRCKSFNICCKVFQFCLTLLYILGVIVLKCFPVSLKLLESSGVFRFSTYSRVRNNRPPPLFLLFFKKFSNPFPPIVFQPLCNIWAQVFKNGPSEVFKVCLSQILLGPFLNTLSQIWTVLFLKNEGSFTTYH